ncbi:hypothetical protein KEM56_003607, partial [Ascosphaera pollenicola]
MGDGTSSQGDKVAELERCERELLCRERAIALKERDLGDVELDDNNQEDDLDMGPYMDNDFIKDPRVLQKVNRFVSLSKTVPKPAVTLYDSSSYHQWAEIILNHAQCLSIGKLLTEKNIPRDPLVKAVWSRYNSWLYTYIWDSLSQPARSRITAPSSHYAYDLWIAIQNAFKERDDIRRACLWNMINDLNQEAKSLGDRRYLERVQSCKTQLEGMNVRYSDAMYFDTVRCCVSSDVRMFMQNKLDESIYCGDGYPRPDENVDQLVKVIFAWLPAIEKVNPIQVNNTKTTKPFDKTGTSSSHNDSESSDKKNKSGPPKKKTYPPYPHCSRTNHPAENCFTKFPEKATGRFKKMIQKKTDPSKETQSPQEEVHVHFAKDSKQKDPRPEVDAALYMACLGPLPKSTEWLLDLACSNHVTGRALDWEKLTTTKLTMANGEKVQANA